MAIVIRGAGAPAEHVVAVNHAVAIEPVKVLIVDGSTEAYELGGIALRLFAERRMIDDLGPDMVSLVGSVDPIERQRGF